MTKEEMLAMLKKSKLHEAVLNVKKAEDTVQNIEGKEIKSMDKAEGLKGLDSELPTQKDVEKVVSNATKPLVNADKDGVSTNGGNDSRMDADKIENERRKQDNAMKDIVNVSTRKVEEADEVNNELLEQLKEAYSREENYKNKIAKVNELCEKALDVQAKLLSETHAKQMKEVFEAVIKEGEKLEASLKESANKKAKLYKKAYKLYENSNKLNKILLEAVKKAQPKAEMVRYTTPARSAVESLYK